MKKMLLLALVCSVMVGQVAARVAQPCIRRRADTKTYFIERGNSLYSVTIEKVAIRTRTRTGWDQGLKKGWEIGKHFGWEKGSHSGHGEEPAGCVPGTEPDCGIILGGSGDPICYNDAWVCPGDYCTGPPAESSHQQACPGAILVCDPAAGEWVCP